MEHGGKVVRSRFGGAVTTKQTEGLLEFIEEIPVVSVPKNQAKRLWTRCAKKLNAYPDGAKKTSSQWARYWLNIKQQISKKAAKVKAAEDQGLAPPCDAKLTMLEVRIWSIIKMEQRMAGACRSSNTSTEDQVIDKYDNSNHGDNIKKTDTTHPVKQKRLRKTTRIRKTVTKLRVQRRAPIQENLDTRPNVQEYDDPMTDSDTENNLSAFLKMEQKKLEDAQRLHRAVTEIRDKFSDMYGMFGELRDGIVASIITSQF